MLTALHPKLPMRSKEITRTYYTEQLGFEVLGGDFPDYLMLTRDGLQLHFFAFAELNPFSNDGQVYFRTNAVEALYTSFKKRGTEIHPNGDLQIKPWGQKEFSLLDPDHNLLTFGETV